MEEPPTVQPESSEVTLLLQRWSAAERFVRSIKESCLDQMIFFGEDSLRKGMREFMAHYHRERNHQGLGNRLIMPDRVSTDPDARVVRRKRLGGMLNYYYYRDAA